MAGTDVTESGLSCVKCGKPALLQYVFMYLRTILKFTCLKSRELVQYSQKKDALRFGC